MVAETSVISMLLNGHQLDNIITCFLYSWQNVLGVFSVGGDFPILLSHADVRLVDPHTLMALWLHCIDVLPLVLLLSWWVPVHAVKEGVTLNLHRGPRRVLVSPGTISSLHMDLVLLFMLYPWSSVLQGLQGDAEASEFVSLRPKFSSVPTIEVSEDSETLCSRAPLHEVDVVVCLQVKTKFLVGSCDVLKTTLSALENVQPPGKKRY